MTLKPSATIFNSFSKALFIILVAVPPLFFGARGEYIPYLGVFFAAVALATVICPLREETAMPAGWVFPIALAALAAAAQHQSAYPRAGRETLMVFLIYGWVYFQTSKFRHRADYEKALAALVAAGAFVAAYGLYRHFTGINAVWGKPAHEVYAGRLSGTYLNPNHAACLLVMAIPAAGYFCASGSTLRRVAGGAAIAGMSVALALTFSRGGMLSAAVMFIFAAITVIFKSGKFSPIVKTCAVIIVLVVFTAGCLKVLSLRRDPRAHNLNTAEVWRPGAGDDSLEARYALAKDTLKMIKDRPVYGSGPGTYQHIYPTYRSHGITLLANAAHNDYLQNASEFGAPFGVLFILFIAIVITSSLLSGAGRAEGFLQSPSFFMLSAAVGFSAFMLVDFNLRIPANGIIFFFALGASSRAARPLRAGKALDAAGRFAVLIIAAMIISISLKTLSATAVFEKSLIPDLELSKKEQLARKALEMDPGNYAYALNAADLALKKGAADKSREGINAAVDSAVAAADINAFDGRAYSIAAKGAAMLSEKDRAKEYIRKAVQREPLNAGFMDFLIFFLLSGGEKEEALLWIEKSCHELPDRNNHYFIRDGRWNPDVYAAAARGFESAWLESGDFEAIRALMALSRQSLKAKDCELPLSIRDKYRDLLLPSLIQWTENVCGNR